MSLALARGVKLLSSLGRLQKGWYCSLSEGALVCKRGLERLLQATAVNREEAFESVKVENKVWTLRSFLWGWAMRRVGGDGWVAG